MSPKQSDIGPLEMEVLGIVDGALIPISVGEVKARLKSGGKDLAYTTVMTVMVRLHNKGMIQRAKDGKLFLYTAAKQSSHIKQSLLDRVTRSFFAKEKLIPILSLLDDDDSMSLTELHQLRGLIEKKIKHAEKKK